MTTELLTKQVIWYEVADSHPAARTTMIRRLDSTDPCEAAVEALHHAVTLEPLCPTVHDRFVVSGGWRGWRITTPENLSGRWVYTRPVTVGQTDMWPPRTWHDCVARYEKHITSHETGGIDSSHGNGTGDWRQRLARDRAVTRAMIAGMGTDDPMNPFCLIKHDIGANVLKAIVDDMRATYTTERPGDELAPRALRMLLTRISVRRATDHLVESRFIDHAERWLCELSEVGASLPETDRLEQRLLNVMYDRDFVWTVRCCAIAAMCDLDPEAAELWYETGGDSSGHPDIHAYATRVRAELSIARNTESPSQDTTDGQADRDSASRGHRAGSAARLRRQVAKVADAATGRLIRCGVPTLTGSVCRHRISPTTKSCPAGHTSDNRVDR